MSINWAAFDWQSFSTLATGAMAVAGAAWVGLRQVRISGRQTEILERQTRLAELTLRHDLFERRYAVYDAARRYLGQIARQAARPEMDEQMKFVAATHEARLLFRPQVHDDLWAIWRRSLDYFQALHEVAEHHSPEAVRRETELLKTLVDDLKDLVDLFGDELKLGGRDE